MSRVQYTKAEAIEKIDKLLEAEFNYFVALVHDEIISVINENAKAGRKKVKGRLEVGYNPFNEDTEHIRFDLDKKEIHDVWKSTLGGKAKNLNDLKKFTKNYDLFCWDYDKYYTFAFKFQNDAIFGFKPSKTCNAFILKLNSMLGRVGARVKYKRTFLVSRMIIDYVCDISQGYKEQPLLLLRNTQKERKDILDSLENSVYNGLLPYMKALNKSLGMDDEGSVDVSTTDVDNDDLECAYAYIPIAPGTQKCKMAKVSVAHFSQDNSLHFIVYFDYFNDTTNVEELIDEFNEKPYEIKASIIKSNGTVTFGRRSEFVSIEELENWVEDCFDEFCQIVVDDTFNELASKTYDIDPDREDSAL